MMTALCAEVLAQTLERCHVKVEILGFTTAGWKGGQSAKLWQAQGTEPRQPGRLNDVRHIVYKSFNQTHVAAIGNLPIMLKDGVLRENIDGEALLWAYSRLARQPEQRKILLAISDGAPVDDATLAANGANYLENHLHDVVHALNQVPTLDLLAIGIGHDVGRYYPHAIKIKNADELGDVLVKELVKLL
jgi:cobaltochelatase CobT